MTNALNINSLTGKNQIIQTNPVNKSIDDYGNYKANSGSITGNNSKTYDYSAIKLTDSDKLYRMQVKKHADSLLTAAETITNKFPPLFDQMISSVKKVQNNINNEINYTSDEDKNLTAYGANEAENTSKNALNTKDQEQKMVIDVEGISGKINNFVSSFNDLRETANQSNAYSAQTTARRLDAAFENSKDLLSDVGITADDSGKLVIDREKLEESIENGKAKEILPAENGFTEKSARIAHDSAQNSDKFIDKAPATQTDSRPQRNTNVNYNYLTNQSIDN